MKKVIVYIHGKGGNSAEVEQYRESCPGYDMIGIEYQDAVPWLVQDKIRSVYDEVSNLYDEVYILANSIGAYFAMHTLQTCNIKKAFFISPILDMERLILDMMNWANVTEDQLKEQGEIPTDFDETLSWKFLCYVREHPIQWTIPTEILYAGNDHLTSRQTVDNFVAEHPVNLTVFEQGEHWFHTDEQLSFLHDWMKRVTKG